MDFKYTSRFEAQAKVLEQPPALFKEQVIASLDALKSVFPKNIKPDESPDILFIASNLVRLDEKNANGDCLSLTIAKEIYKKWINKLVDIEHDRKHIVGFILNSEFVNANTNEVIPEDKVDDFEGPIDIAYAAAVWKLVSPNLCAFLVEASDPKNAKYGAASSSLELGLDTYQIVVSPTTSLKDGKILTNQKEIKEYTPYLQAKKGSGRDSKGNYVFRNIIGYCLPTGAGLVANPASNVNGVFTLPNDNVEETEASIKSTILETPEAKVASLDVTASSVVKDNPLAQNKTENFQEISQIVENNETSSVNINTTHSMTKITKIEEITASLFKDEARASEVTTFIADHIAKASEQYVKDLSKQSDSIKALENAKAAAEQSSADLQKKVTELAQQLNKIEEAKAASQAEADFENRMKAFDEEYDLDQDDRKSLSTDIKACKNKEEFDIFAAKMKPLMKEKSKALKKAKASSMEAALKKANITASVDATTLDFKEIVASVAPVVTQTTIPNAAPEGAPESLMSRMSKLKINFNGKPVEVK